MLHWNVTAASAKRGLHLEFVDSYASIAIDVADIRSADTTVFADVHFLNKVQEISNKMTDPANVANVAEVPPTPVAAPAPPSPDGEITCCNRKIRVKRARVNEIKDKAVEMTQECMKELFDHAIVMLAKDHVLNVTEEMRAEFVAKAEQYHIFPAATKRAKKE